MPKGYRNPDNDVNDPEYQKKRQRNNEAIRRTRERQKQREIDMNNRINHLSEHNKFRLTSISQIADSFDFLKTVYQDTVEQSDHEEQRKKAKMGLEAMKSKRILSVKTWVVISIIVVAIEIANNDETPSVHIQERMTKLLDDIEKPSSSDHSQGDQEPSTSSFTSS